MLMRSVDLFMTDVASFMRWPMSDTISTFAGSDYHNPWLENE